MSHAICTNDAAMELTKVKGLEGFYECSKTSAQLNLQKLVFE